MNNEEKNLINIEKIIYQDYMLLSSLEKENKTNTYEYKEIVKHIRNFLEIEQNAYKEIKDNEFLIRTLTSDLIKYSRTKSVTKLSDDDLIKKRLESIVYDKELGDDGLSKSLNRNLYMPSLKILNYKIDNIDSKEIKNYLIDFKYKLAFLSKSIEEYLIDNQNLIIEEVYLGFKALTEAYELEENEYAYPLYDYLKTLIISKAKDIISHTNDYNDNSKNFAQMVFHASIIEGGIINLPKEKTNEVIEYFKS